MNEYGFFSKDVALKLDINASTLRQWCKAIEDEGYKIERNEKEQRIFYERDINMLFELKGLIEKTRNRENAIKTIASRYNSPINAINPHSVNGNERDNITVSKEELESIIERSVEKALEKQMEFNEELLKRLDQQQKYIDERLEQRDKLLMESIRQSQEEKQAILQIAAAQEEEKKKGFFARIFGK